MAGSTQVPSQLGRTAVVTGATGGLGYETALALSKAGAEVILTGRDDRKGRPAIDKISHEVAGARLSYEHLDLASLASVADFAQRMHARQSLDLLINNAGVMALPRRQTTADGFEMQFGTNHLGHFALTARLMPLLRRASGPRVVSLSSLAHRTGFIDFNDLQGVRVYSPWKAYGQSKLGDLMLALELDRRLRAAGSDVRSLAAHPGYASTNLQTAGPEMSGSKLGVLVNRVNNVVLAQSAEKGALPTLFAATQDIPSGAYVGPDGPFESRGNPHLVSGNGRSRDPETARRLWDESERLTGVTFAF